MTFDQYIQNPMGIKNSVISNREMYRSMYTDKLNKILLRESGKVVYYLFKNKDKTKFYVYIKVPSEVVDKFYYDVVVEFSKPDGLNSLDSTLRKYDVKFYSNDPSFVFTFAHAFIKNGIFIPSLKDKMSKKAIKENPDEKNPTNQVGYVKSLYFAFLIMNQRGLFNKILYMEDYNEKKLKPMIMDADQKISLRQQAQTDISNKNKKSRKEIKQRKENIKADETPIKHKISNVVHTKNIGTIKKTNNVKKTKTIGRK